MVRAGVLQPYDKQPAASALDLPHRVEDKQALFEMCEMLPFVADSAERSDILICNMTHV